MHYDFPKETFNIGPSLIRKPFSLSPRSLRSPGKISSLKNYAALYSYMPAQTLFQEEKTQSIETYEHLSNTLEDQLHWGVIPQFIDFSGDEWLERSSD